MAKGNLPPVLTKTSKACKLIAMGLFILLPFVGFYLGMEYQKMITPAFPSTTYEAPQKAVSQPPIESGTMQKAPEGQPPVRDLPAQQEPSQGAGQGANPEQGTMCTMEARQCPDGSWAGRSGPNCEFVCPGKR